MQSRLVVVGVISVMCTGIMLAQRSPKVHLLKASPPKGLFVIFGEPDIQTLPAEKGEVQGKVFGVDVFDPTTGGMRGDRADRLKTTLKAETNEKAWATLHSDTWRPFPKPNSGHRSEGDQPLGRRGLEGL